MYRYGLGDCFLLTFTDADDEKYHILIDCGVISRSKDVIPKMKEVAENIYNETDKKIDLLIATHEHWDHVSGFSQARDVFKKMDIKKIWLGWTEDPKDKFAKELKDDQKNKLKAVGMAYEKLKQQDVSGFNKKQEEGLQFYLNSFNAFFNFFGFDGESMFNINATETAMDFLRKHEKAEIEYLSPEPAEVIEPEDLPGIRVYVLGPPKNLKSLKKMNPSKKSSEVYEHDRSFAIGMGFVSAIGENADKYKPFLSNCCLPPEVVEKEYGEYFKPKNSWRKIDDDWMYSAGNLAIALDNMVNNTCLALAFEFIETGKVLLFPGDAQIGNWLSWWDYSWQVKKNGKKESVTIEDLFSQTVFYKVGHHGSHNATLKDKGLEKMSNRELIAMIPVDQVMSERKSWKMPFPPLLDALNKKTKNKVIIMDETYPSAIKKQHRAAKGITDLYYDVIIG